MIEKILIYGSNGWIGSQFKKFLRENTKYIIIDGLVRLDNMEELGKEIKEVLPSHIIGFTGRTHGKIGDKVYSTIDYLEEEGKLVDNIRDNLQGPLNLSIISKKMGIHYTYLGTGCIFEYDLGHPFGKEVNGFTEECKPNFFGSSYSIVKGFTDKLLHNFEESVLNLRIRMPITADNNPRNFISKITKYSKICSIPNSMTVLPDFYPIILDLMEKDFKGTLNLTNPGLISHNEMLEMYKEIVDKDFTWENFSIEEQDTILASKRSNNFLDTSKLEEMYPEVLGIKDSVRKILLEYR
uniref:NAD-dependent epimerase/dehydratase domain-containing protein n=1 Tax=viral metagenome TaxID=1070528 RepID=A0A6C0J7Z6_9ZZZZ